MSNYDNLGTLQVIIPDGWKKNEPPHANCHGSKSRKEKLVLSWYNRELKAQISHVTAFG